jgi:LCP family protein required for cell wall assembly
VSPRSSDPVDGPSGGYADGRSGGGPGGGSDLPPLPPELDPRRQGRRRHASTHGNYGHTLAVSAGALFTVVSVFCLVAFAYGWWNYRKLNNNLQRLNVAVGTADAGGGPSGGGVVHDIDGKDENILIVGNDDRSGLTNKQVKQLRVGRDGGSENTDTMMLVHIPANGAKATLVSLPRDSYVSIPGYGMNRLNAAYAFGFNNASGSLNAKRAAGANLLIRTVHTLTGLTIDHFVQVSLIGFVTISDAVGGVTVNLCHAVDDTVAYNEAHGQGRAGSGLKLSAGKHTIKGVTALEFVRQRHNLSGGDLDRVKRQQYFLTAAFRKIESAGTLLNFSKLNNLIKAIDRSIWVDKGLNLSQLAKQVSNLSANNIVGKTIPTTPESIDGNDVLAVNPTSVRTFVASLIQDDNSKLAKAKKVAPGTVTVDVINGGSVNGAAAQNASTLRSAGFRAVVDTSSARSSVTLIQYPKGMESQAKTLAGYVPGATYDQTGSVHQVTLLLGADGLGAKLIKHSSSASHSKSPSAGPKPKPLDAHCIN